MISTFIIITFLSYVFTDSVIKLTDKNFRSNVLDTEDVFMVEFFAPWCGHCRSLAPEYKKAADNTLGLIKFGAIDCDDEKELCSRYQVKGFPTLKLFTYDPEKRKRVVLDYNSARTAKPIVDFSLEKLHSYVKYVTLSNSKGKQVNHEEFLKMSPELPKVFLFSDKSSTTPLYKALSIQFNGKLLFAQVLSSEKALLKEYGISTIPTLIVLKPGQSQPEVYSENFKYTDLAQFLEEFTTKGEDKKGDGAAKFDPTIKLISSQTDLEEECLKKTGVCVISFLIVEPEFPESVALHEANLKILSTLKKKYHDKKSPFIFLQVDGLKHRQLMKDFDVADSFPAMLLMNPNRKMYRNLTTYFDLEAISKFLDDTLKGFGRSFAYTKNALLETPQKARSEEVKGDSFAADKEEL